MKEAYVDQSLGGTKRLCTALVRIITIMLLALRDGNVLEILQSHAGFEINMDQAKQQNLHK
jgi:5,10-methenyltetrahydromethanopterin hydrogenase